MGTWCCRGRRSADKDDVLTAIRTATTTLAAGSIVWRSRLPEGGFLYGGALRSRGRRGEHVRATEPGFSIDDEKGRTVDQTSREPCSWTWSAAGGFNGSFEAIHGEASAVNLERMSREELVEAVKSLADLERVSAHEKLLRRRFEILDQAALELNSCLARIGIAPLDALLQAVVERARILGTAEFAALGIGSDVGTSFKSWTFAGMNARTAAVVDRSLRPKGLHGRVVYAGHPFRLRDLREHPGFVAFPVHGTDMRSLLGVRIPYAGRTVGSLYLANKLTADEFSEDDEQIIEMFAERAGVTLEIARLANEVRTAVAARDNLLAVVSHDLRSPLSAIQLSATHLTRKDPEQERRRNQKQVGVILRSAERMNRLIDDLLQAATIEAGKFSVDTCPDDVNPIVEEAIQALEPLATARRVHLLQEVSPSIPRIQGDRQRIIQVLSNLVENAISVSAEGASIRIRVWTHSGEVRFSVSDDGQGMTDRQLAKIFERYAKGKARGYHGVGLGLYIARSIVEAHSGRIWAESRVGIGTTFYFTIPVASADEQHATAR